VVKIIDKFEISIFTLEQMLEEIKSKSSVEIKQNGIEEKFIKIYNSMQKYVHTPEQRKKSEKLLKEYNKIQVYKDDVEYPKRLVYKSPLSLNALFENMGKPLKIKYQKL